VFDVTGTKPYAFEEADDVYTEPIASSIRGQKDKALRKEQEKKDKEAKEARKAQEKAEKAANQKPKESKGSKQDKDKKEEKPKEQPKVEVEEL
jgi:hypothetical protein